MSFDKVQAMLNHICEMQKLLYDEHRCETGLCKTCSYNNTCRMIANLLTAVMQDAWKTSERSVKDDNN